MTFPETMMRAAIFLYRDLACLREPANQRQAFMTLDSPVEFCKYPCLGGLPDISRAPVADLEVGRSQEKSRSLRLYCSNSPLCVRVCQQFVCVCSEAHREVDV